MFNPCAVFETEYLQRFIQKGVIAFVKQSYPRGKNPLDADSPPAYLLTHFSVMGQALHHYSVVKEYEGSRLYKLDNPDDLKELNTILTERKEKYFTSLTVPNVNDKARKVLDRKIKAFIDFKTNLKPKGSDSVGFTLEMNFGEIYAELRCGSRKIKVKLDELETLNGYV